MTESADQFQPRTEAETREAALAVLRERSRCEDHQAVESLTDREKLLIEHAWRAGARCARDELQEHLASPHAVTLDAAAVARAVSGWASEPYVFDPPRFEEGQVEHDPRVVNMVRGALRHLAAATEA